MKSSCELVNGESHSSALVNLKGRRMIVPKVHADILLSTSASILGSMKISQMCEVLGEDYPGSVRSTTLKLNVVLVNLC